MAANQPAHDRPHRDQRTGVYLPDLGGVLIEDLAAAISPRYRLQPLRHLAREAPALTLQTMGVPLIVTPRAPTGEQNDPG